MRIIAGTARGRRLVAPQGRDTRPTTDRVRESLFSILASRRPLQGLTVLDLYAGTGALGCEALSRGAAGAVFIDHSREADQAITENLRRIERKGYIHRGPVLRTLAAMRPGEAFDLVLMDPPYKDFAVAKTLAALVEHGRLKPGALIAADHSPQEPLPQPEALPGALAHLLTRRYGSSCISLWRAPAPDDPPAAEAILDDEEEEEA